MGRAGEESWLITRLGSWRMKTEGPIVEDCKGEREEGLTKRDLSAIRSLLFRKL